jgi:Helix-turn-helix domain
MSGVTFTADEKHQRQAIPLPKDVRPCERESAANNQLQSPVVDEHGAARFLGVSVSTVRRWRWLKTGPVFRRIGGCSIRYEKSALEAFLKSSPTGGGGQPEKAQ